MRSEGTGESYVRKPLSKELFYRECDVKFEVDWYCSTYGVTAPQFRQSHGTRKFHGSYNPSTETINYTHPYLGVILHETAHHICHKLGLNGHGNWHDERFGKILQEMIDEVI